MLNSFNFIGRLTKDPELKTVGETNICEFSVAVARNYKNKNNEYESDFFNCTAFGKTADFVSKYFGKGSFIGCHGEVHIDKYEKDGSTRYSTKITISEATFCEAKKTSTQSGEDNTAAPQSTVFLQDTEDDLPF